MLPVSEPALRERRELRSIAVRICEREAERFSSIIHTPIYKKEPSALSDEECAALLASCVAMQDRGRKRQPTVDPTTPVRSAADERRYEQLLLASRIAINRIHRLDTIAHNSGRTGKGAAAWSPITSKDHERIESRKDRCRRQIRTLSERLAAIESSEMVVSQRAQIIWRLILDRTQLLMLDSSFESELIRGRAFLRASINEHPSKMSNLSRLAKVLESAIRTWSNRRLVTTAMPFQPRISPQSMP